MDKQMTDLMWAKGIIDALRGSPRVALPADYEDNLARVSDILERAVAETTPS